ncbi:F0F1 ATP synthase subunit A [Nocardioides sp. DS6]|uniref:ATP synthase subunit a n=1 Tax=Nocardioides eburneus TaxID=3231482 RepID=A0ABV3T2G0_9ACTN
MSAISMVHAESYTPPGPGEFDLPGIGSGGKTFDFLGQHMAAGVTKPMIDIVIVAIVIFVLFAAASRKRAMVPGRLQFAGESMYGFVRNSLSRDIIGSHDAARFTPYLFALFAFILLNNFLGSIPFFEFPTFGRAGMVYPLAIMSWCIYNYAGIKKHGLGGYIKLMTVPGGVRGPILLLLCPLEALSNFIVRPITLALRLFCNMFAGHLLLILFATGGLYLVEKSMAYAPVGVLAWVLFIGVAILEVLIQFLQAYVFVLLNAMYISGAVADEH